MRKGMAWLMWLAMSVLIILNYRLTLAQPDCSWQGEWDALAPWLMPGEVIKNGDPHDLTGDDRYYLHANEKDVIEMVQRLGFRKLELSGPRYDEFRKPLYCTKCCAPTTWEEFTPTRSDIYYTPDSVNIPGQGDYRLYITQAGASPGRYIVLRIPSETVGAPLPLAHPELLRTFRQWAETLPGWLRLPLRGVQILLVAIGMNLIFNGSMALLDRKRANTNKALWYSLPLLGWLGNLVFLLHQSIQIMDIPGHPSQYPVWLHAFGGTAVACIVSVIISALVARSLTRRPTIQRSTD